MADIRELTIDDGSGNGSGNDDVNKAVGLDKQNKNSELASHFFLHFFAVSVRLRRENA